MPPWGKAAPKPAKPRRGDKRLRPVPAQAAAPDAPRSCVRVRVPRCVTRANRLAQTGLDGSPVIAGNRVAVGSTDGRLYLLDLKDGREVWSYEIGAPLSGSPAVAGGMIVIGADDGRVYAFGGSPSKSPM